MNRISSLFNFIANKIGNTAMGTTATTLTGAIKEHEDDIAGIISHPDIKWYRWSTGSQSWASGLTTTTVQVPATQTGYTSWVIGGRATSRYVSFTWTYDGATGTLTLSVYNSNSSATSCYVNGFMVYFNNNDQLSV